MKEVESRVAAHYGSAGLLSRIEAGLRALGVDPASAKPGDLKAVDEFHIGGARATDDLLARLDLSPGAAVLDIGSGLGGTARRVAAAGARVTGVDLTPEYVETARALTRMVGLDGKATFLEGSALALPVEGAAFDIALLVHVGMNIADKPALMREARRVLKPGGAFAIYDVMRGPDPSPLPFPLPWAETEETSFVAPLAAYEDAARGAGFAVVGSRGRRQFAIDFFTAFRAALAEKGPPPLGLHLLMGGTAPQKVANMLKSVTDGRIEPTELILRGPAAA